MHITTTGIRKTQSSALSLCTVFFLVLPAQNYVTHIPSLNAIVCGADPGTVNLPAPPPECTCSDAALPNDAVGQCDICCATAVDGFSELQCTAVCAAGVPPLVKEAYDTQAYQILEKFRKMQRTGNVIAQQFADAATNGPVLPLSAVGHGTCN